MYISPHERLCGPLQTTAEQQKATRREAAAGGTRAVPAEPAPTPRARPACRTSPPEAQDFAGYGDTKKQGE
jgi:hypothetical protein